MAVQLRIPHAGALKMGLPSEGDAKVVEAKMSVVELAGRLTLATGKAIAPNDVQAYLAGVRRARLALQCILRKHDRASLVLRFAVASCRRRMWAPSDVDSVVSWLSCVLLAHCLAPQPHTETDEDTLEWAQSVNVGDLVDMCETHFATAYHMWVQRRPELPSGGS